MQNNINLRIKQDKNHEEVDFIHET